MDKRKRKAEKKIRLLETLYDSGRRFSNVTLLFHELVAHKAGLAGADHKYLGILVEKGSMTAGELASVTGLTTGAITGVIDRLQERSLVRRERDKIDRRKVLVIPDEEKAQQMLGPAFQRLQHKLEEVFNQFSESETEIIIQYLDTVSAAMTELIEEIKASDD